ncbi:hypothetical protein PVAP13_5NG024408 [Panicum virgatum]|uniref:Uncharacterized protein n=1 Tax=Panicum virgatum TaxID=38727 RepID=A0A8T0RJ57_PANVG|nr:hypothetical protein PVAP13_5NG024408 [Panicum virgatum]
MATALLPPGRGLVVRRGRVLPNATSTDGRLHPRQALAGAPLVVDAGHYASGQAFPARRWPGGGRPVVLQYLLACAAIPIGVWAPAAAHLTLGWSSAETSGQPTIRFLAMPCLFLSLSDHTTPGPGEERMDHGWRQWHVAMGGPAQSRQPVTPANTLILCALSDESFFFEIFCQMRV